MRAIALILITFGLVSCGGTTGGTYAGDVIIVSSTQLEDWLDYAVIEGNLTIKTESASPSNFAWPNLEQVTGIFTIQSNHRLKSFSLENLQAVDLALVIKDNDALINFNMESLSSVGSLGIQFNDVLPDCRAEAVLDLLGDPAPPNVISDNGGPC